MREWIAKSQSEAAMVLGISSRMLQEYCKRGCPGDRGDYPIPPMIEWLRKHVWQVRQVAPDEDLGEGDSPALERFRLARAQQEEIKLEGMRGDFIAKEDAKTMLMEIAAIYKSANETLVREFGNAAGDVIADALDEAERRFLQRWGDDNSTGVSESEVGE